MSNENKIRILYVQPGKYPEEQFIANELHPLQRLVGGYMQAVYPCSKVKVALVCNDSGKVDGLPLNRCIEDYDVIAGNFFICGFSGEEFCTSCYPMKCAPACWHFAAGLLLPMASYAGRCLVTPIFPAILVTMTLTVIPGIAARTFLRRRVRRSSPPTAVRLLFPAGTTATATRFCWTTVRACPRDMPT